MGEQQAAASVRLFADKDYNETGNYIARITGRKPNVKFERDFVGKVSADVVDPGLYEVRHASRKGKRTEYWVVVEEGDGLVKKRCDEADALTIAKNLDAGHAFSHLYRINETNDGWIDAVKVGAAKKAAAAATIEGAVQGCQALLAKLTAAERRKVIQALKKHEQSEEAQPLKEQ